MTDSRTLDLPIKRFQTDELLATADEPINEAYILVEGRVDVYALDSNRIGVLMESPVHTLNEGDLVNPELLTIKGSRGINSSFTLKAQTPVSAHVVTLKDLFDQNVSDDVRHQRIAVVTNALASSAIDATSQRVHRIEETTLYEKALEPTKELERQVAELTERATVLQQANERSDTLMGRITKQSVDAVLMQHIRVTNQKLHMFQDPERLYQSDLAGFLMYLQELLFQLYRHPDAELACDAVALSQTIYKMGEKLPREGKFVPSSPTK